MHRLYQDITFNISIVNRVQCCAKEIVMSSRWLMSIWHNWSNEAKLVKSSLEDEGEEEEKTRETIVIIVSGHTRTQQNHQNESANGRVPSARVNHWERHSFSPWWGHAKNDTYWKILHSIWRQKAPTKTRH